ncbi:hypothetical protein RFI_09855 [Reticulomyxa filosa]|uniref:Uncharacterized protein n=1 Tax=Reticulomyxa filosa TaxID=46433 RepID=X6NMP4_RETFI|nr:hypothetical protein RFI_09855 [Reticulomyxa filosa]|eukprot:ETO27276.1 hypothetical protein RFI_09855 [Reticulomyxa filosa]
MTDVLSYRTQKMLNEQENAQLELVEEEKELPLAPPNPTTEVAQNQPPPSTNGPLESLPEKAEDDKNQKKVKTRAQKQEELAKAAAELEFFYLTCIAVKANLSEEFPEFEEQIQLNENPVELYKIAQVQAIEMSKFGIWIETRIRQKYSLPELGHSRRFKMPKIVFRRPSLHLREKIQHLLSQSTPKTEQHKSSVVKSPTLVDETGNANAGNNSTPRLTVPSQEQLKITTNATPDPALNNVDATRSSANPVNSNNSTGNHEAITTISNNTDNKNNPQIEVQQTTSDPQVGGHESNTNTSNEPTTNSARGWYYLLFFCFVLLQKIKIICA